MKNPIQQLDNSLMNVRRRPLVQWKNNETMCMIQKNPKQKTHTKNPNHPQTEDIFILEWLSLDSKNN